MVTNDEVSLNTILEILDERELENLTFFKRIIQRISREGDLISLSRLMKKANTNFIFGDESYKEQLLKLLIPLLIIEDNPELMVICKRSILGSIAYLCSFINRYQVVTLNELKEYSKLAKLDLLDETSLRLIPKKYFLRLNLDERVKESLFKSTINDVIQISEILFQGQILVPCKDTVISLQRLYEGSDKPGFEYKGRIISALLEDKIDVFLAYLSRIHPKNFSAESDIIDNYIEIYNFLRRHSIPVFYDFSNIKTNRTLFNGNFYFLMIQVRDGTKKLLTPFQMVDINDVQKIFDLNTGTFMTPKCKFGRLTITDIFSFRKTDTNIVPIKQQIDIVKNLSEDEIEEKIRLILKDLNPTPHGPTERLDIISLKLRINNEDDVRIGGFIIKGKGYPKVTLGAVSNNIVKAVFSPIDLIILVHTGTLLDEALVYFIKLCEVTSKMYLVFDARELVKLFISYEIL